MDLCGENLMKTCTKCGAVCPLSEFKKDPRYKGGHTNWCRTCYRDYDKLQQRKRRQRPDVKEKLRAHRQKPEIRDRQRQHEQKPEAKERRRNYMREKRKDPEFLERSRQYRLEYEKRPETRIVNNAKTHRRRARILATGGTYTKEDIELLYKSQKGKCWWCGKKVGEKYHVDHRIPLVKGGTNHPRNLVISCPFCNQSKHDKLPHEWRGRLL
jgi:hypothetical protein